MKPSRLVLTGILCAIALSSQAADGLPPEFADLFSTSRLVPLVRNDVATALHLTDGQKSEIRNIVENDMKAPKGGGFPSFLGKGFIRKKIREKVGENESKCLENLGVRQIARLDELWAQYLGPRAVYRDEFSRQLGINRSQDKAIGRARDEANRNLASDRVRTRAKERETLQSILTADQKEKLVALGGKPFAFDDQAGAYAKLPMDPR